MATGREWHQLIPYALIVFVLLSLYLAISWRQASRDRSALRIEMDDALVLPEQRQEQLNGANAQIAELTTERDTASAELDNCRAASLTSCIEPPSEEALILNVMKGQVQISDAFQTTLLRGELEDRVLNTGIFKTSGTLSLSRGAWALVARGIGGESATNTPSNFSPRLNPVNEECWQDPDGSWHEAHEVICDSLQIGWEIRSRYPYATLAILPIDNLLPRENE